MNFYDSLRDAFNSKKDFTIEFNNGIRWNILRKDGLFESNDILIECIGKPVSGFWCAEDNNPGVDRFDRYNHAPVHLRYHYWYTWESVSQIGELIYPSSYITRMYSGKETIESIYSGLLLV